MKVRKRAWDACGGHLLFAWSASWRTGRRCLGAHRRKSQRHDCTAINAAGESEREAAVGVVQRRHYTKRF